MWLLVTEGIKWITEANNIPARAVDVNNDTKWSGIYGNFWRKTCLTQISWLNVDIRIFVLHIFILCSKLVGFEKEVLLSIYERLGHP